MAERQAARVLARKKEKYRFEKAKSDREQAQVLRREEGELLRNARKARKEDWELGPLAPKRDVGDAKRTYGALSAHLQDGSKLRDREVSQMLNRLGWVMFNIVEGDRVVLLQGRDKGKIGKVIEVDKESAQVKVDGLNMVRVSFPSQIFRFLHIRHLSTKNLLFRPIMRYLNGSTTSTRTKRARFNPEKEAFLLTKSA